MHDALLDNIAAQLSRERNRPVFIVIDGPAGAGKTTLARTIVDHFAMGEVIHCDDLYHGWEDALTPTLEEHFQEWILTPLRAGAMPSYRKFDWHQNSYQQRVQVPATSLLILEGVGAALASVTDLADLAIWIDVPADIGLERVLHRDGREIHEQMVRWISEQQAFFARHRNRENCTIHLSYGEPAHS